MDKKRDLLLQLNIVRKPKTNLILLRTILGKEYTRIDFGFIASNLYVRGGWIKMFPDAYLRTNSSEVKYKLTHTEHIPLAPDYLHFKSNKDWRYFSLFFEPIPKRSCKIDLIEVENPENTDFNYYGIKIDLNNAEEIIKP
ncbi:hypothetical protein OAV26_03290 [Crocinitomicaceae bacterium]|nr:hypothetical protein [Crocinitomicaceae bacterium]